MNYTCVLLFYPFFFFTFQLKAESIIGYCVIFMFQLLLCKEFKKQKQLGRFALLGK